jgi:hypothetical protein
LCGGTNTAEQARQRNFQDAVPNPDIANGRRSLELWRRFWS